MSLRLGSSLRRRRRRRQREEEGGGGNGDGGDGAGNGPASGGGGDDRGGRWRRLGRAVAAVVGVLLLGLGIGWLTATQVLFPAPPPPGDLYAVPDVRGLDVEAAGDRFDRQGLSLGTVDGVTHPEVDSGTVVGQSPLPGQLAPPDEPVRVTLSLGPERQPIPDVRRLSAAEARTLLRASGFTVVIDSVRAEAPEGRVVGTEPAPGTRTVLPAEVHVQVSRGPPRVAVPSLLGMSEEEAREALGELGLSVGRVEEVFRFGRDQGRVVGQAPPADSLVERGTAVHLTVGRRGLLPTGGRGAPARPPPTLTRGNNDPRAP